jgi:hypothetical protein
LAAALLLTASGCGGDRGREQAPKLPRQLAADLARQSDAVAERLEANDPCAAQTEAESLQEQTIAAVNDGRVPARYQEELTSAVNSLLAAIECVPPPEPPPPTTQETQEQSDEEEDGDD